MGEERANNFVVVAAVTPVWATVAAAREFQWPAGRSYAAYQAGVEAILHDQAQLEGRLSTVAISGEPVVILERIDDHLISIELPAQPNGAQGYVGFVNAAHVALDARRNPTHVVMGRDFTGEMLNEGSRSTELPAGATVELIESASDAALVMLSSGKVLRCSSAMLRRIDQALDAAEVLNIAKSFVGVPYVWGGAEGAGIDCSGLVHTAARIGGRVVPRDAHHQWVATAIDATWADLELGDILYFGDEASLDGIDHVGLYAGNGRMLHAPEAGRAVVLEPVSASARARSVAFGRLNNRRG